MVMMMTTMMMMLMMMMTLTFMMMMMMMMRDGGDGDGVVKLLSPSAKHSCLLFSRQVADGDPLVSMASGIIDPQSNAAQAPGNVVALSSNLGHLLEIRPRVPESGSYISACNA